MAAVMRQAASATTTVIGYSSRAPRQTNDFIDRGAVADVMAVADGAPTQGGDEEIWMISYIDIMTLLLTLFVLLLAYTKTAPQSTPTAPKMHAAKHLPVVRAKAPRAAAQTTQAAPVTLQPRRLPVVALPVVIGKVSTPVVVPAETTHSTAAADAALARVLFDRANPADTITPPLRMPPRSVVPLRQNPPATVAVVSAAVVAARQKILDALRTSALGKRIELTTDQNNVNLEISDRILFDPSSATLKQNGRQLLDELVTLLAAQDYTVSIEGHTDNVPFSNARFASNWELSATRATNVTRYLIAHGIAAARLRAIGYADTRPRADNATAQGRARNRRVALVLHMPVPAAAR